MRKIGVELLINNNTICILAGELDNENLWSETGDTDFISNMLSGLTVEICDNKYVYTIKDTDTIQASFVNLETGERLCDYFTLEDLVNIENSTDDIQILSISNDAVSLCVLNESIMIRKIKLISFKNKRTIFQIVM